MLWNFKVRIATHPNCQGMGYGGQALSLLQKYFEGKIYDISEANETSDDEHTITRVTDDVSHPVLQVHTLL